MMISSDVKVEVEYQKAKASAEVAAVMAEAGAPTFAVALCLAHAMYHLDLALDQCPDCSYNTACTEVCRDAS